MIVDVLPYKFAAEQPKALIDNAYLKSPLTRFAKKVASEMSDLSTRDAEISLAEEGAQLWSEYSARLPGFTSLNTAFVAQAGGGILLRFDDALIPAIMNGYYGGQGDVGSARSQPIFRPSELRFIGRIANIFYTQLHGIFHADGAQDGFQITHETSSENLQFCEDDVSIWCQTFEISFDTQKAKPEIYTFDLVFTPDALAGLSKTMGSITPKAEPEIDRNWQRQWRCALDNIHLPMRAIVGHGSVRLPDLFNMKVGDVLPIIPQTRPSLLVGNRKIAIGELGEKDGCAAYKIQTLYDGDHA